MTTQKTVKKGDIVFCLDRLDKDFPSSARVPGIIREVISSKKILVELMNGEVIEIHMDGLFIILGTVPARLQHLPMMQIVQRPEVILNMLGTLAFMIQQINDNGVMNVPHWVRPVSLRV